MNGGIFLESARLILRPLCIEDLEGDYITWLNSKEVCVGNGHHVYPYTAEKATSYIEGTSATNDVIVLAIEEKTTGKHIGNIALSQINLLYRSAELAFLIGDKNAWGKGYGKECGMLLIEHAFDAMNLNRIGCGTFNTNIGMQKLALALGFKKEGARREAAYKNGVYQDIIVYGLLKSEWDRKGEEYV